MAFNPPSGNSTVMVDNSGVLQTPTPSLFKTANGIANATDISSIQQEIDSAKTDINGLQTKTQNISATLDDTYISGAVTVGGDIISDGTLVVTGETNTGTLVSSGNITDGSGNILSDVADEVHFLQKSKILKGEISIAKPSSIRFPTTMNPLPATFSMAFRLSMTETNWSELSNFNYLFGDYATGENSYIHIGKSGNSMNFVISQPFSAEESGISRVLLPPILDGKYHDIIAIATLSDDGLNGLMKFFIDNQTATNSSHAPFTDFKSDLYFAISYNGGWNGKVRDFYIFNFDISKSDAPYTISDYHSGKQIPVSLLNPSAENNVVVAIENYTVTDGTTKKIFDYSGHNYDPTCLDNIVGSDDIRIKKFIDYIKSLA